MRLKISHCRTNIFSNETRPCIYKILLPRKPMAKSKTLRIEFFRSPVNEQFYFHIKAANGKLVVQSEGYKTKQACQKTASLIAAAKFVIVEGKK